jgi:uncharacterized metal-binding protein YceD (DUF177 family)
MMMVIREDLLDLNDVIQHPGRTLVVDITTELSEEEDIDLIAPLDGFLDVVSTGNLLLVKGEFSTRTVLECSRCSGPIEVTLEFEIDEQFPVVGIPSALSHQDYAKVEADEPYPLFEGNNLMVEALLRQNLLLNMPVQSLCEFGWDGDCPVAKARDIIKKENFAARAEFEKLRSVVAPSDDTPQVDLPEEG